MKIQLKVLIIRLAILSSRIRLCVSYCLKGLGWEQERSLRSIKSKWWQSISDTQRCLVLPKPLVGVQSIWVSKWFLYEGVWWHTDNKLGVNKILIYWFSMQEARLKIWPSSGPFHIICLSLFLSSAFFLSFILQIYLFSKAVQFYPAGRKLLMIPSYVMCPLRLQQLVLNVPTGHWDSQKKCFVLICFTSCSHFDPAFH